MALSDKKILEEKKKGNIIITPFVSDNLNTSSYDVTLGEYFYREQASKHFHNIYNIYQKSHTEYVWGVFQKAEKASKVFEKFKFRFRCRHPSKYRGIYAPPRLKKNSPTNHFLCSKPSHSEQANKRPINLCRHLLELL